jgi:hypothetical protein
MSSCRVVTFWGHRRNGFCLAGRQLDSCQYMLPGAGKPGFARQYRMVILPGRLTGLSDFGMREDQSPPPPAGTNSQS